MFEALGIVKKTRNLITYCSDDIVIKTSKDDEVRAMVRLQPHSQIEAAKQRILMKKLLL